MQVGMRQFLPETIVWLGKAAGSGASRFELAAGLCAREDWRNARGALCLTSAHKSLDRIAAGFNIKLPPPVSRPARSAAAPEPCADIRFEGELDAIGAVTVEPAASSRQFRSMMATHHPRGAPDHPGGRLLYWIRSESLGRVGAISFHAANWHQRARDKYIGWSARARAANLGLVVNNSRLLILPGVRVNNLASRALALAIRRLPDDWEEAHGRRPLMATTFTASDQAGSCYAAAGWELVGTSSGAPPGKRRAVPACGVWMRPLAGHWRQRLTRQPRRTLATRPAPALPPGADWADLEFGFGSHPDGRVRKRIRAMAKAWETSPGEPIPVVFPDRKDQRAAYRLLSSPMVDMDDILESHRDATAARCLEYPVVLAVQDTTMLNYTNLKGSTGGLARIGGGGEGSLGIPAHAVLAVSEGGRGLGLLGIDADFRQGVTTKADRRRNKPEGKAKPEPMPEADPEDEETESQRWRDGLKLAQQLGEACPDTRVISVCDREGDIREMFADQASDPQMAGLLVRACASKQRKVIDADGKAVDIREHMAGLKPVDRRTVHVKARGGQQAAKGRKASTELRIARVNLKAPGKSRHTLPVIAVLASETSTPPNGQQPLRWLLICSDGEPDRDWAERIIKRYEARWTIEEYFRTLKQCTRIEDRRLDEADDLRKCLAFDAVIAWRTFDIQKAAKAEPERPALDFFDVDELTALYSVMKGRGFGKVRGPPFDTLNIRDAAIDVGRSVGFIPSKRQPLPGTRKIRQGMKFLIRDTVIYKISRQETIKRLKNDTGSTMV